MWEREKHRGFPNVISSAEVVPLVFAEKQCMRWWQLFGSSAEHGGAKTRVPVALKCYKIIVAFVGSWMSGHMWLCVLYPIPILTLLLNLFFCSPSTRLLTKDSLFLGFETFSWLSFWFCLIVIHVVTFQCMTVKKQGFYLRNGIGGTVQSPTIVC